MLDQRQPLPPNRFLKETIVIARLSAALILVLCAGAASAQQAVNPKPMSEEERAEINAQRRAGCKGHSANLKMLQVNDKIEIEERGKRRLLTTEERNAQIAETQRVLEQYCGEKPAAATPATPATQG